MPAMFGRVKTLPYGIVSTFQKVVGNDALHRSVTNCSNEVSDIIITIAIMATFRHDVGIVPYGDLSHHRQHYHQRGAGESADG